MRANSRTCFYLIAALMPVCTQAGCGSGDRSSIYPVEGKVFVAGVPAAHASVFFYPCDPTRQRIPVAITDADGTFRLTTLRSGDGAPEGYYDVTVIWPDYSIPRDECVDPLHDRLKLEYADRSKTELHAIVRPEKNGVVFHLQMAGGWSVPRQRDLPR